MEVHAEIQREAGDLGCDGGFGGDFVEDERKRPTIVWLVDRPFKDMAFHNADYSGAKPYGDKKMESEHRVKLTGLKPGTEYTFAIAPTKEAISPEGFAVDYRFVTKPPKGMALYREVPLAVLCYMNVTHEGAKNPDGTPVEPTIRDEEWYKTPRGPCGGDAIFLPDQYDVQS